MTQPEPGFRQELDLLVLGSGVAGLSAAVRAASGGQLKVGVLTKGELSQATTRWAQGGIAAVLGGDADSTDLHLADTLAAGAGLCDTDAVRVLVDEGPARVKELIDLGATFDRDPDGELALAREGGHSHARVVHAGGAATGREVERALVAAVRQQVDSLLEGWFAFDLLVEGGRCAGVRALPPGAARPVDIRARQVLLATGGSGELYSVTTNPAEASGDGMAMALRAGAVLADVEFVQFHPTALHHPVRPRPLLTEALRGHGAKLLDHRRQQFVDELLPRDQVSRAITRYMLDEGVEHVWLDTRGLANFAGRFPSIAASLAEAGFDPAQDLLPVAPAAHYMCGGVLADLDGASSLPGLWVAGEVACNGVHGANRLASNSLLDGMVFGARVVEAIELGKVSAEPDGVMADLLAPPDGDRLPEEVVLLPAAGASGVRDGGDRATASLLRSKLQGVMTAYAGVVRTAASLDRAGSELDSLATGLTDQATAGTGDARGHHELRNLAELGRTLVVAAAKREETRGAHTRTDFPERAESWAHRILVTTD